MANTLMFEVGVKEAGNQLTQLENRLKEIVTTYGSLKIKVEVENLQTFVNALKEIGDGKQLKPLLDRIDALQQSLVKMNGTVGNVDMSALKSQLKAIEETQQRIADKKKDLKIKGLESQIPNAILADNKILDGQLRTLEKNFGMVLEVAKNYVKTAGQSGNASSALEKNIKSLSQSISELSGKSFSVNMGTEFKTWAEQVQALVAQVKDLVAQFEKLHSVQGNGNTTAAIDSQTQAINKESEAYKQLAQWREQAEKFHKDFGKTGLDIVDWHAHGHIAFPKTMRNGDGAAFTDYDVIKNHVYALKEEATLLKERQALIDKYSSVSDVGQKQRYNQILSVYNEVYDAMQKLKQEEAKPAPQGGLFDPQKFSILQEAIDKIISEINRLKEAFAGLGDMKGLSEFHTKINGLMIEVNNLVEAIGKISGAIHIDKSVEEIAAYEKQIANLKTQIESLQTTLKQAQEGMKMVSSGKGSEATQNTNLDTVKAQAEKAVAALEKMNAEYKRMEEAGAQNAGLQKRINDLKDFIAHLEKVKSMDLSKVGALKATDAMFNGNLLFGQVNKQMYSDKSVKEFSKIVDETIKAKSAADSLNDAFERMKQKMLGVGSSANGGMRGVSAMMESITTVGERNIQTLIKERAHIERLIAVAEKSIRFGEGHDVAGMQGLRVQQRENLEYLQNVKNAIDHILTNRNTPEWMRFLNTPGSLRIPLGGSENDIALLGGHFNALTHSVTGTSQAMRQLNRDMRVDNSKEVQNRIKEQAQALKNAERENKTWADSMDYAKSKANELRLTIEKLESVKAKGVARNMDMSAFNEQIEMLRRNLQTLYAMAGGSKIFGTSQAFVGSSDYRIPLANANNESLLIQRAMSEERRNTASATRQLSDEEQRLASALGKTNSEMRGQSQVMSDLKMMAYQYLSIWGAQQFVHNIIEIGGQLEKQRLSIGAILKDISHANDLFGKIKDLAVRSPFGVVELDQFTKQLSAYGFKYNELYDMTKRLADIAAGAGTDVSRLTLAIGHVRAEGALSGYTLRQFAMNNIPMLSELSKKLSEVEGRMVSAAEVRKRISKKEIGYDQVIDVIKDLTNEGGIFYNMQETISESIQARFKNLKDSLDIMYGEIAESGIGDAMKDLAVILTNLTRNWKSFIPIIAAGTASFLGYKSVVLAMNMTIGKQTGLLLSNALAYKKKRAGELQHEAMVRKLTAEELALVNTQNRLTVSNIKTLMSTNAMTKGEALKLVALRKVSIEEVKALVHMGAFSAAEARMALQGKILGMQLGKTGAMIKLFARSAVTSLSTIAGTIFSPAMAAFAAMSLGFSAWQKMEDNDERRNNRKDSLREQANEGYKNLIEATKNFSVGASQSLSGNEINLMLDDMMDKLREYSKLYNVTFNEAFKVDEQGFSVHNLAEQYEILAKSLKDACDAQKAFNDMRNMIEHSLETSDEDNSFLWNLLKTLGDWTRSEEQLSITGDLTNSLEYYAKTVTNASTAEQLFLRNRLDVVNALSNIGYSDAINMDNQSLLHLIETIKNTNSAKFVGFYRQLDDSGKNSLNDMTRAWEQMNTAYANANLKMRRAGQDLFASFKVAWGDDMAKWPSYWREVVMMAMDSATKDVKGFADMSIEYQNLVRDSFLKPFGITIDSSEAKEKVNALLVDLQNLVGNTWTIKVGVKGESAWDDIETAGKKYKEADEKVKKLGENLKRLNYQPGPYATNQESYNINTPWSNKKSKESRINNPNSLEAQKVAEEYNEAIAERRAARILYEAYGGDINDLIKDKKPKGNGEDKEAKRLREIAKLYKDAYNWYKKYEKQLGDDQALFKVKEQFQPLFDEFNKEWKTHLSIDNIPEYKKNLKGLLKEAQNLYKQPKHRNNYMVDAIKEFRDAINDVDFTELETKSQKFVSAIKNELDSLTRSWELFNNIRTKLGNTDLASRISGAGYAYGEVTNLADALKKKIEGDLSNIKVGLSIDFNENMSDKDIEEEVQAKFDALKPVKSEGESDSDYDKRLSEYQEKINGIVDETKKWRDLQRDVQKEGLILIAEQISSAKDYDSQIDRINTKLAEQIDKINKAKKPDDMSDSDFERIKNRAIAIAKASAESEKFKLSSYYINIMNNGIALTRDELKNAANAVENDLNKSLQNGTITTEQFANELEKVHKIVRDINLNSFFGKGNAFNGFASGGVNGLVDWYDKAINKRINELGKDYTTDENGNYNGNDEELKKLLGGRESWEDVQKSLKGFGTVVEIATGVLNGLSSAAQSLSDMFYALGSTQAGDTWSDIADGIKGVSSVLQPVDNVVKNAQSGNISGLVSSVLTAPVDIFTGPITAFAQLHDKSNQRVIDALQKQINAIEANTAMIKSLRSRSYGYDSGEVRRNLRDLYSGTRDEASKAMYNYYNLNSGGNSYTQELKNLQTERAAYMRMYNEEEDKKNSSSSALESYKEKIAELDEQIMFFFQDLAKDLWNIDIKEWADQIGDALWNAFENGEDALEAFHDTAKSIVSDVAKRMMKLAYIEPMLQGLQNELFGIFDPTTGQYKGGKFVYDKEGNIDMEASQKGVLEVLGKWLGGSKLENIADGAEMLFEWVERITGMDLSNKDSKTSNKVIQGGFNEDETGLLLSYVNAIRADVSVNRSMIEQYFPMFYAVITGNSANLRNIENHTAAIMRSNDAIKEDVAMIYSLFKGLKSNAWKMPMA